ncbi:MAG: hypothetical protein R3F11_02935 [Verrucomicrobiales bacterium]
MLQPISKSEIEKEAGALGRYIYNISPDGRYLIFERWFQDYANNFFGKGLS